MIKKAQASETMSRVLATEQLRSRRGFGGVAAGLRRGFGRASAARQAFAAAIRAVAVLAIQALSVII
jgi:hypothetical protein